MSHAYFQPNRQFISYQGNIDDNNTNIQMNTLELVERLGLKESVLEVIRRCGLRWMGHVLGMEDEDPIKMAWELHESVAGRRGRPKNDLEGHRQEGSEELQDEGRGCVRSGQVEQSDMDKWKQQPIARWKQCCLNDDDDDDDDCFSTSLPLL